MQVLRLFGAGLMVVALVAAAGVQAKDDKKDNATLIQGSWLITKSFEKGPPVGTTVVYGKDGKYKAEGKDFTHEGTWKVDGDVVTITRKDGDAEIKIPLTIKNISRAELVLEKEAGKVVELKRKK